MRVVLFALGALVLATPAQAQDLPRSCAASAMAGRVDVETTNEGTIRGTMFCLSADEVTILRDGELIRARLSNVRRIAKPADPVWDGAAKGAAVVLTLWGVTCGFCDADATVWRAMAGYALLGASLDALQTNTKTIYSGGGRSAALRWRVRF